MLKESLDVCIGIDALNIQSGGGLTHLIEVLARKPPLNSNIKKIVVWAEIRTLNLIPDQPWLLKICPDFLNGNLLARLAWQKFKLPKELKIYGCNILFVPGGTQSFLWRPSVVMHQNLLPFHFREIVRYGLSFMSFRLLILRIVQGFSIKRATGVIFLSHYAYRSVISSIGDCFGKSRIIAHGFNENFRVNNRVHAPISSFTFKKPFKILYVASVDQYKHQWNLVKAVSVLRKQGLPVVLDLVGAYYLPAYKKTLNAINAVKDEFEWVRLHSSVPYEELKSFYAEADMAVCASTCEAFGITLLEGMAASLPLACSNRSCIPEIVENAAIFFDPESPVDIAKKLNKLVKSHLLRANMAQIGLDRLSHYSWDKCAYETYCFLASIAAENRLA